MKPESNRHYWTLESFLGEPSLIMKPMFGCIACYLHGKLMLVLADDKDPWNGILVATAKEFHESLIQSGLPLVKHPVLGKWLYLSANREDFEETAGKITDLILKQDPRIGVEPKERKRKVKKK